MSKNILEEVNSMAKNEREYAKELYRLSELLKHPVLQALIKAIALDSEKHGILYESIIKLLQQEITALSEEEIEIIQSNIKRHIEVEEKMIELAKKLASQTDDPKLKLIFSAIIDDEIKHHRLLVDIKENIVEKYKLTEENIWDMVWKDSPWHGTPGG